MEVNYRAAVLPIIVALVLVGCAAPPPGEPSSPCDEAVLPRMWVGGDASGGETYEVASFWLAEARTICAAEGDPRLALEALDRALGRDITERSARDLPDGVWEDFVELYRSERLFLLGEPPLYGGLLGPPAVFMPREGWPMDEAGQERRDKAAGQVYLDVLDDIGERAYLGGRCEWGGRVLLASGRASTVAYRLQYRTEAGVRFRQSLCGQ